MPPTPKELAGPLTTYDVVVGVAPGVLLAVLTGLYVAYLMRKLAGTGEQTRRALTGFLVAIASALTWALGNVVTRYSAQKYDLSNGMSPVVDISLANYVSGAATTVLLAALLHVRATRRGRPDRLEWSPGAVRQMTMPGLWKGACTYSFVAAVSLVSSAAAATIENLHVVVTAMLLSILQRRVLPLSWFGSALVVVVGTALVVGFVPWARQDLSTAGVVLSLVAALTFSLFVLTWRGGIGMSGYLPSRALVNGVFLALTAVLIFVIHLGVSGVLGRSIGVPFTSISTLDVLVQLANGTFNIGVTYFLMSEALRLLEAAGRLSSLLLGLAMSYSVPFTVIAQFLLLGETIGLLQWCGVAAFLGGFVMIRESVVALEKARGPAEVDAARTRAGGAGTREPWPAPRRS